jgi:hypothetical protein
VAANALAQEGEQRWPLFKTISLARPEPTPELSAQERQRWSRQEKPVVEARKPALSLPAFNEKLIISLGRIAKQAALGAGQTTVRAEQARMQSGSLVGRRDEPLQFASNHVSAPNAMPIPAAPAPTMPTMPAPQFLKPPVVALNREVELRSFEHTAVLPADAMSDLPDVDHADDSLQSLFGRIQGKEKVAVKPEEKRSSFFDRLGKR